MERSAGRARLPAVLATLLVAVALGGPGSAEARARRAKGARGTILLDGRRTEVRWTDGDSFRVDSGPLRGFGTRLVGCNALESYGPVHRIGTLTPGALHAIARSSASLLARTAWRCDTTGRRDGYGRALVACPDAAAALIRAGHAMVYAVGGPADPALLAAQREVQAKGAGMWAGGVPPEILTSVHSAGEKGLGRRPPYVRLVDTRTGVSRVRVHGEAYRICEEVCVGAGSARSCLVYVPFERRYRKRAECLGPEPAR